ncbi:hypothetical protein FHX77_000703 [Bifidobacterium commune]|uniref:UvrD/REP helicase N-terminal domain-containing protein n=2 Tax=Bifidobacterium commune TaxID=1505727 RepID=A0A1C4GZD8_9BIFI|nr:hypothetical protein [Bifidobacterium commune]SCC77977.1 UvrD/REP helicase N-terminal domain-containing protein [Bifidobacterium commune]
MDENGTLDSVGNAAMDAVKKLLDAQVAAGGDRTHSLLVAGPPCSGKTEFAVAATLEGISRFGDAKVLMAVSGRQTADRLSDRVIRAVGSVSSARPVTTLSAIAFRLLSAVRESRREPLPKLLNGAEQDALLRQVVAVHVRHVQAGELCGTCGLMRQYFANKDWVNTVYDATGGEKGERPSMSATGGRTAAAVSETQPGSTSQGIGSSDVLFSRGVSDAFVMQLRDMLARMDELGVGNEREDEVLSMLEHSGQTDADYRLQAERLGVQWRLAFALRREYVQAVAHGYPSEFRLDSSRLLVEGAQVVAWIGEAELPALVVVDDFQDLTLAGLAFLEALAQRGVRLVLVGDPDEAVQTFRGSYPEYLFERACEVPIAAEMLELPVRAVCDGNTASGGVQHRRERDVGRTAVEDAVGADSGLASGNPSSYLDVLASRVSLSIAASDDTFVALPDRPGKLPRFSGALPIEPLDANNPLLADSSVKAALYHTEREELDDVVWRIKEEHLSGGREWNEMAVIAHDNSTVRAFGERLRRDGVPVRYSAVTKPLKDDLSVQGLFALLELAGLRRDGIEGNGMTLVHTAKYIRSRVQALLESPLVSLRGTTGVSGASLPARLAPVESVMKAIASLAHVLDGVAAGSADASDAAGSVDLVGSDGLTDADGPADSMDSRDSSTSATLSSGKVAGEVSGDSGDIDMTAALPQLQADWQRLRDNMLSQRESSNVSVDDSLIDGDAQQQDADMPLGVDALYVMLALGAGANAGVDSTSADLDESRSVADEALGLIMAVGNNAYTRAFSHVWKLVGEVERGLSALPGREPEYALDVAWKACRVDKAWQCLALVNNDEGRAANDRLDVMMRLFAHASGAGEKQTIEDFIASVRSLRIEADSLAKVAPIDQAVTLTTPAGAAGVHWSLVFITQIQQDVWPNLAARNTMFGGENLADIVLRGCIGDVRDRNGAPGVDSELAQVLLGEQKSFLVALTRASGQVVLSAVLSDDAVPSDFLYTYVPEWFDRVRDADPEARNYTQLADSGRFVGLDTSSRGLVSAARIELMRQAGSGLAGADQGDDIGAGEADERDASLAQAADSEAISLARTRDAARSLVLLERNDLHAADPDAWPYTFGGDRGEDDAEGSREDANPNNDGSNGASTGNGSDKGNGGSGNAGHRFNDDTATEAPMVVLSPSQVDRLWSCPVCWMLESQFAGPRPSNVATSFGSVIHNVAQKAGDEGLDAPDFMAGSPDDERIAKITDRMMEMYLSLADDLDAIDDPEQRYQAERKDEGARQTLTNIATYFVESNNKGYPYGNLKNFSVGRLERSNSELTFTATFNLDDIRDAYNAIDGIDSIGTDELASIMGTLCGGWPEGMRNDLWIRLTGRIDRMEWRDLGDGKQHVRLIDWKTGHKHNSEQMLDDLQLVCYQLGLAFPDSVQPDDDSVTVSSMLPNAGLRGVEALNAMPDIAQSALFDVDVATAPAQSYGAAETLFQPALFRSGAINSNAFMPRSHYPDPQKVAKLANLPDLPEIAPEGVGERTWEQFLALRGTQAVWALTMIARIVYAAAASRSHTLVARPQADHVQFCNMNKVCPACAGEVDTVYEVRRG